MSRVNGLYGHIQRNNAKGMALIAAFLVLFLVCQFAFRLMFYMPLADQEAAGVLPPPPEHFSFYELIAGIPNPDGDFAHRVSVLKGEVQLDAPVDPPSRADSVHAGPIRALSGPERIAAAMRLYYVRGHYLWLQALVLSCFALFYVFNSMRRTALLIRFATRARPLERKDYPELYNLVENLALSAGLPCPAIELIQSKTLNAYATGLTPKSARIGLTTGLIETLSRVELEAVIAHEITHIRNGDTRLMAINKACADLVLEPPLRLLRSIKEHPFQMLLSCCLLAVPLIVSPGQFILMAVIPTSAVALALLCKAALHHAREFVADAGAIELTKNPVALISALHKMSRHEPQLTDKVAFQAMMFSSGDGGLLSTHPTLDARIQAITVHAGVRSGETVARQAPLPIARQSLTAHHHGVRANFGRRGQSLAPAPNSGAVAHSFVMRSAPQSVLGDNLPPPPEPQAFFSDQRPPTLREQIEMEGLERYLMKRPYLYVPFFIISALLYYVLTQVLFATR